MDRLKPIKRKRGYTRFLVIFYLDPVEKFLGGLSRLGGGLECFKENKKAL